MSISNGKTRQWDTKPLNNIGLKLYTDKMEYSYNSVVWNQKEHWDQIQYLHHQRDFLLYISSF